MVTTAAAEEQTYGLAALRMSRRGSAKSIDTNPIRERRNSFMSYSGGQQGSLQVPTSKTMMIGREVFIRNYPQLLMAVMLNDDGDCADDNTDMMESRGVDLCFTDLSLSIKLGKKSVDVVNKVTGRIRAKTMTALMGGSGAGKTSVSILSLYCIHDVLISFIILFILNRLTMTFFFFLHQSLLYFIVSY
jgi:ABC-type glutathione transport system ATPase component